MNGPLDIAPAIIWASGVSTLLALGTTLFNLLTAGARKNDTRIADLACKLDDLDRGTADKMAEGERRMQRIEDRLATVPTAEMMHRLDLQYASIAGELGKLDERLKPVASIAERMQEILLEQARGRS